MADGGSGIRHANEAAALAAAESNGDSRHGWNERNKFPKKYVSSDLTSKSEQNPNAEAHRYRQRYHRHRPQSTMAANPLTNGSTASEELIRGSQSDRAKPRRRILRPLPTNAVQYARRNHSTHSAMYLCFHFSYFWSLHLFSSNSFAASAHEPAISDDCRSLSRRYSALSEWRPASASGPVRWERTYSPSRRYLCRLASIVLGKRPSDGTVLLITSGRANCERARTLLHLRTGTIEPPLENEWKSFF